MATRKMSDKKQALPSGAMVVVKYRTARKEIFWYVGIIPDEKEMEEFRNFHRAKKIPATQVLLRFLGIPTVLREPLEDPLEGQEYNTMSSEAEVLYREYHIADISKIAISTGEDLDEKETAKVTKSPPDLFVYDPVSFKLYAEDPNRHDVDSDSIEEAEQLWESAQKNGTAHVGLGKNVDVRLETRKLWSVLFKSKGKSMPSSLAEVEGGEEEDEDEEEGAGDIDDGKEDKKLKLPKVKKEKTEHEEDEEAKTKDSHAETEKLVGKEESKLHSKELPKVKKEKTEVEPDDGQSDDFNASGEEEIDDVEDQELYDPVSVKSKGKKDEIDKRKIKTKREIDSEDVTTALKKPKLTPKPKSSMKKAEADEKFSFELLKGIENDTIAAINTLKV